MEDQDYYGSNGSIRSNNHNTISTNTNNNDNTTNDISTVIHRANFDFSNQEILSSTHMSEHHNNEGSMDIILDNLLRETHAHNDDFNVQTSNYIDLFHAELLSSSTNEAKSISENDESIQMGEQSNCNKRARREKGDNKEAVRRYREKLKAREAELQEEANKLKAYNQELLNKLQDEEALQDKIYLLKCLLVDIRGRIEGEICSFRHFKPSSHNANCSNCYNQYMIQQYNNNGGSNNGTDSSNVGRTTPTLPSKAKKLFNFKKDV